MPKKQIPFFSLAEQTGNLSSSLLKSIASILENQNFVGGDTVLSFEKKLAETVGAAHAISCNSGTDALWLALKALDLKPNTIVLTTPFSFIASSSEIVALDAHPVFIDIDKDTYNISPKLLEEWLELNATMENGQALHNTTKLPISGMVVVDLFGQCADFAAIKKIAHQWGLWIVEDACQAIGSRDKQTQAGTFGDIGTFSFYPTKNLGAIGDAGACVTNDPHLAETLLRLRNHGRKSHYEYETLGINSRMDGIQAAALSVKIDHLENLNNARRAIAQRYHEKLAKLTTISLPQEVIGTHVYHQFSITTKTPELRNLLQTHLTEAGIGSNIFYPKPLFDIPFLNTHKDLVTACPVTKETCETILALPIWPELKDEDVDDICESIKAFDQQHAIVEKPVEKKRMKREERLQQASLF